MKRIINILIIFVLVINLSACKNINNTTELSTSQILTDINKFEDCTQEEIEQARKDVEIIIQSILNRDVQSFKSVLTKVALQEIKDIDLEINYIFNMLKGEIINFEECSVVTYSDWAYHEKRCVISMEYKLYTETQKYLLYIRYLPHEDTEYNNVGVFAVRLSDYDKGEEYAGYHVASYNTPGIFSSDKQSIDENIEILTNLYKEYFVLDGEGKRLAMILNAVGTECIEEMEIESFDENGLKLTIVDSLQHVFYIETTDSGWTRFIYENNEEGKMLFYGE